MYSSWSSRKEHVAQTYAARWMHFITPASVTGAGTYQSGLRLFVPPAGPRWPSFPQSLNLGAFKIRTTSFHHVTKRSLRMKPIERRRELQYRERLGLGDIVTILKLTSLKTTLLWNFSVMRNKIFFFWCSLVCKCAILSLAIEKVLIDT